METVQKQRSLAKKVFFLYPHSVIQDQLLTVLIQAEYEVALVNDHKKATQLLYRFPSSVLFINIEAGLDEAGWEQYVRALVEDREKHDARVGILTYNPTPELAQKYLMDIGVQCGFVALKLGLPESAKIILRTLEANEAKGDRRFVRVKCPPQKSTISVNHLGRSAQGVVLDISSAGMACELSAEFKPQSSLDDIQVVIWGTIIKLSGLVMGHRPGEAGKIVHVIMFGDNLPKDSKAKVYATIRKILQGEIDAV